MNLARSALALLVLLCAARGARAQEPTASSGAEVPVSTGTVHAGAIRHRGAALPERARGMHWLTNHGNPGARYATPALVAAVTRAVAAIAAAHPGADLAVYDFSVAGGGRIRGHASHTSGRDGDVGLYAVDAAGAAVVLGPPVRFDARGRGRDPLTRRAVRFDPARTWELLAALLTDPTIDVRALFLFPPLRTLVLAHARSVSVAPELLERATRVIRASGRANAPHDDHFHIRVACSPADLAAGCLD